MKRIIIYTLILGMLCLCFTGCTDSYYQDGIDALNDIEAIQAFSTASSDVIRQDDDDAEKVVLDSDEETDINALFDNLFEQREQASEDEHHTDEKPEDLSSKTDQKQTQTNKPAQQQNSVDNPAADAKDSQQNSSAVSDGVWIPQSGSKYHSHSGCSNMKNPSNVTLQEALEKGFTACKRCF